METYRGNTKSCLPSQRYGLWKPDNGWGTSGYVAQTVEIAMQYNIIYLYNKENISTQVSLVRV